MIISFPLGYNLGRSSGPVGWLSILLVSPRGIAIFELWIGWIILPLHGLTTGLIISTNGL